MIEVRHLHKTLGTIEVLRGVGFAVPSGGAALIGRNGAGKSTLLRILAGLWVPDSGTLSLGDGDRRRLVGWMPEWPELHPGLTPRAMLELAAAAHGVSEAELQDRIDRFGVNEILDRPAGALSYGQKRAATLALATLHRPRVLLLDEPTNGLDPVRVHALRSWLTGPDAPETWLISTHHLDFVATLTARFIVLREGRVVADGELAELRASAQVSGEATLEEAVLALIGAD